MAGLGFFGLLSSSLQMTISSNFITAGNTTDPISVTATNTGGGTLSYLWKTKGISATINTPTSSSTTVTVGGVSGITELYCDITNSVTGTTYPSPSCFITWLTTPDAPTIGTSSSADKSFTINWTAPTYDGGAPITGYYVQNSTNNGVSWSGDVSLNNPSVTSYNWFGNGIIFDGSAYIGRVAAVNSIGQGPYSTSSAPPRIPTFAAPTLNSFISIDPSTVSPTALTRPFRINFTPTNCIDYYRTYIYIKSPYESFGNYYDDVNGLINNLYTDLSNSSQTTFQINNVYAVNGVSGPNFYTNGPSQTFNAYCRTFNNDGYYVDSSINNFTTIAPQSGYTYNPPVLDPSSTNAILLQQAAFTTFNNNVPIGSSQTNRTSNNLIASNNYLMSRLDICANLNTTPTPTASSICDATRAFRVDYGGNLPNSQTNQYSFLGDVQPWTNNLTAQRVSYLLDTSGVRFVNYGNFNKGRIRAYGIPYTNPVYIYTPNELNVTVQVYGQVRTPTNY